MVQPRYFFHFVIWSCRGHVPLWLMTGLAACLLLILAWWTQRSISSVTPDGREKIVFWGSASLGADVYSVVHQFEEQYLNEQGKPTYQVILGTAVARDLTGDAQRLLSAVAGGVPPDLVWFDRFAIGEWAGRGALEDLTPYLEKQNPAENFWDKSYGIQLAQYYPWAIEEASYRPPGSSKKLRIYGIPTTVDIRVLYTNLTLLQRRGIDHPPRDWEELRAYASSLTEYAHPADKEGITRLGFAPNFGNSWLYLYAWQAGGEFMNPDRTLITMTSPPVVRALRYMADIYDDLGGFAQVDAFQQSFQGGALDPFLLGKVAMKIDGDWALTTIADWKRDMNFVVTPPPMPRDQLARGRAPLTWAGGWAYVIPKTAQNKEGAWRLIQFLSSRDILFRLEQGKREQKESEGKLYLPTSLANRVLYEELIREKMENNPHIPPPFKHAYSVFQKLMPNTRIRPVTPVGQLLWEKHRSAYEHAVNHTYRDEAKRQGKDEVQIALERAQADVQQRLNEMLKPFPQDTQVDWRPYFWLYGGLVVLPFILLFITYHYRKRQSSFRARAVGTALLFISPWMIGFIIFVGGPIFFSIVFSFMRYDVLSPAHHIGIAHYRQIMSDPLFCTSLFNTLFMMIRIPLMMACSLAIALLLNRGIRGLGFYRTVYYLPAVVPLVASSLLWVWLFNPSQGVLNYFLGWLFDTAPFQWLEWLISSLAHPFQFTPPLWLQDQHWSKPALIIMALWTAGSQMIIWLSGLQAIPLQLYEAASVDGAGPWKRFCHVTLPMLTPYILFNAVVGVIYTMQMFGEAYIMTEGGPVNSTLFYAYYLFKQAFQFFQIGYASALAWILFLVVLTLTLVQLWLSKKWVHYE